MRKLIFIALMLASFTSFGQVETIRYLDLNRHIDFSPSGIPSGYIEVTAMFRIPIPASIIGINNISMIANTYKSMYRIDHLDTIANVVYACFNVAPITLNIYRVVDGVTTSELITDIDIQVALEDEYVNYAKKFEDFELFPFDNIIGKSKIGEQWENSY